MRIDFTSSVRPERIAKAMRGELARLGHDIRYARVREAVAAMYGYASWNDLLGRAGKAPASPDDRDAGPEVAAARRTAFADRLSAALGIPRGTALAAVDAVGPASRRASPGFDVAAALRRMARSLAESDGEAWIEGDAILARFGRGGAAGVHRFVVGPDGAVEGPDSTLFGWVLQDAGLGGGDPADGRDVPRTLSRLDARALGRLRCCRGFDLSTYAMVRGWGGDHPFGRLLDALPMLAYELTVARNRRWAVDRGGDTAEIRIYAGLLARFERMIASPEPIEEYLDLVRDDDFAIDFPHLTFDRAAAEGASRALGRFDLVLEQGMTTRHVALLSLGPPAAWPATAADAAAAIRFMNYRRDLFMPYSSLRPDGFFAEFDGRWGLYADLAERAEPLQERTYEDVAGAITRACAARMGRDTRGIWDFDDDPVVGILADRIGALAMRGKGFLTYLAHYRDWHGAYEAMALRAGDEPPTPDDVFRAVLAAGILPEEVVDRDPLVVLGRLGIDPARFLDAVEGADGDEASVSEIEARISTGTDDPFPRSHAARRLLGSRTFHEVEIDGVRFSGILSDEGPRLRAAGPGDLDRSVALTPGSAIVYMSNQDHDGWAVPGPGEPIGVRVDGRAVAALRREFGLGSREGGADFQASPAFEGLRRYVRTHPRIALDCAAKTGHMPGWYEAAMGWSSPAPAA